jgi:3-hydroxyisobutyrate dehydrogenase
MTNIAFIGVGNMGGPMARNLLKAGHKVTAFDLSDAVLDPVLKAGATKGATANEAVKEADIVITMLPAGQHVRSVYLDNGVLGAAKKGALLIDSSTIDVDSARAVHAAAEKAGFLFLDAPVSGGTGGAEAGTLTFMCGGSGAAFEKARPILEKMGKKIAHAGGPGAGRQDLQQHDARHLHDRHLRSAGAWREARPGGASAVRHHVDVFGAVLVAHGLLPGAGAGACRAVQS